MELTDYRINYKATTALLYPPDGEPKPSDAESKLLSSGRDMRLSLAAKFITEPGRGFVLDVFKQVIRGPVWDGSVASKNARDTLYSMGLIGRIEGWQYLTDDGVVLAQHMGLLRE